MFNSNENSPSVVIWAIKTMFSGVGPVTPSSTDHAPPFEVKMGPSLTSPNTPRFKPMVTKLLGCKPGMSPSAVVNGMPAAGSAFANKPSAMPSLPPSLLAPPTIEPLVSSALGMPHWVVVAWPMVTQLSRATVFSSTRLFGMASPLISPRSSLLKNCVVVSRRSKWLSLPYTA